MKLLSRIITGSIAALMTLCVSAAGYADYADCNRSKNCCKTECEPRCQPKKDCCQPKKECCAPKKKCCTPPKRECCAPQFDECCDECWGFTVFGDLLYWTVCQDMHYATSVVDGATTNQYLDYDWDLGFRLGLEFDVPCSCWEGRLVWTHFSTDVDDSIAVAASVTPNISISTADSTTTSVDFEYDTIDFVLAFPCCLCDCVEFKPFGGVRGLWLDIDTREINTGIAYPVAGDGASRSHSYEAVGLYGGFDWKTNICDNWSIFGRFAGSAVVGNQDSTTTRISGGVATTTFVADSDCHGSFGFEARLGAGWETCICDWDLAFTISYDFTLWTDINNPTVANSLVSASSSDVTLHGGSLGASFKF